MTSHSGHPSFDCVWERPYLSAICRGHPVAFINSLPEDILITIFKFVLSREGRDETYRILCRFVESKVETSGLIVLSHVCTLWRDILLGYPLFWTRMDGNNSNKLLRFIARSQSLPISLFLTSRSNDISTVIRSYGYRVKRLDLTLFPNNIDPCALSLSSCPMLECVTLNFEYDKRLGEPFFHATPFLLFGQEVLPFKALAMTPLSGCFPANHFPNMTHMCIGLDVRWGEDTINFSSTIFDLLSNTPTLQFLSIHGLVGWLDSEPVAPRMPVRLNDLHSLLVSDGELSSCASVLSALSIPQVALIRLYDLNVIPAEAPQLSHIGVLNSINRLSIQTEGVDLAIVTEGPGCTFWLDSYFAEDPFDEPWDNAPRWGSWLLELPGWLPLGQVLQLEISVGAEVDIIFNLLPLVSNLTELRIRLPPEDVPVASSPNSTVAGALYATMAREDPLLCPSLRVLNVEVDISHGNHTPTWHIVLLAAVIEARHRRGHPIHRVVLQPFGQDLTGGQDVASLVVTFQHLSDSPTLELRRPAIPLWPCQKEMQSRWDQDDMERYWDID